MIVSKEKVIIVGAGPCGMSCAIELKKKGIDPLLIEKGNVANSIYHYPTHQTFFSSSDKLEIGGIPFITEKQKPVRMQALTYYRTVAERTALRVQAYEQVIKVEKEGNHFQLHTIKQSGKKDSYQADKVVIATGYYDHPNLLHIPGESLPKVMHYFKEGHPYYKKNVVIIGGKNSAVDAALELHKAGANITVIYRGSTYSKSIKPWILPDFDSLVEKGIITMEFGSHVTKITEDHVYFETKGTTKSIPNDFVFAMTGYRPDVDFLRAAGVQINPENGKPYYDDESYETNVSGLYIAGVIAAGFNNNKIFIENGRFHGEAIAKAIEHRE